jgi:hypothetical protein
MGTCQSLAVVAFGSEEPRGNCWLEPGSSVTRRPLRVVWMLSGWWISLGVWTGLSSPSTSTVSDVTFVGSFGSSTIFQTRPFVDLKFGVSWL